MKTQVSLALALALSILISMVAAADQISKTKGNRAIVKSPQGQYKVGDVVVIRSNSGATVGRGKVLNVSGKGVLIQADPEVLKSGYEISGDSEASGFASNEGTGVNHGKAVSGYLGQLSTDGDSLMTFGGDFLMTGAWPNIMLRGGLLYSTKSENEVSVSVTDISGGGGYLITKDQLSFDFGARIGFATISIDTPIGSVSESSIHLTPYASATVFITPEFGIGGEFRLPLYSNDEFDSIGSYILINGTYRF